MSVIIIAAIGENGELGKDNDLMWSLPNDFKRFRKLTLNKNIIMGRKTFESLPGILPQRNHIVITRDEVLKHDSDSVIFTNSINSAVGLHKNDNIEQYIIGGGEIYKQSMDISDKLEITKVHGIFNDADTFFPIIDTDVWKLVYSEYNEKDDQHLYPFTYQTWIKK